MGNNNQTRSAQNEPKTIVIHITGEVIEEGIINIEEGARIASVIEKAGGTTGDADLSQVNLAYRVADGQKIYIPSVHDNVGEMEVISINGGDNVIIDVGETAYGGRININKASQTELETLAGVRPIYST
jgi:competence protein ComEA